ncbi:lyase family protein [Nocardioides bruguierae]|uniref:Lyase family protein n=1 Tax=Nocardioides bruguierae TaxID=2945102 RepID=A0A9X2DAF2_9ACTN|nr:lyase family protein [Nocardioides bruguierae]MCM0622316.1 lyase family protein [Nocardioides bruguierae]
MPQTPAPSLLWPGDHRAGRLASEGAYLDALLLVEETWLRGLVEAGVAPADAWDDDAWTTAVDRVDPRALAEGAESGGNPVIGLLGQLRGHLPEPARTWLHRGLTSQDVVDTALVLVARDALVAVAEEVDAQVALLAALADAHRGTVTTARTLTQPAVPTTFGARAAGWLQGVLDARDRLAALRYPVQVGGAGGTLSGLLEVVGPGEASERVARALAVRARFADALGLADATSWHTSRGPVTAIGDACVTATDAWGRVARDVLVLVRPEVGELGLAATGGSSTMPHKANPTAAVLLRRSALAAPGLAATLHAAAADQVEERADGAWHAEWAALTDLLRRTVVAARHATDLLAGLEVRVESMAARAADLHEDLTAEQRTLAAVAGHEPGARDGGAYLGLVDAVVDEALARAGHRSG